MEIYKGVATFSGIAIGKILYYSRGEYQIRQCLVSNIKKEIDDFQKAREQAVSKLRELYETNKSLNEQEARAFLDQAKLLDSESFQRAIESSIANEKVNAAYAVMTNRDELVETFRNLEEPVIRKRISDMQEISNSWRCGNSHKPGRRTGDPCCGGTFTDRDHGDGQREASRGCHASWLSCLTRLYHDEDHGDPDSGGYCTG